MNIQKILKIFKKNNGIMRLSQARACGIQSRDLSKLVREGKLVKEGVGIYRLSDLSLTENTDLALVSKKAPKAVICLVSALAFHNLTTQIPNQIQITLPIGQTRIPKLGNLKCSKYVVSGKAYSEGIEVHEIHGVKVKIYGKEKTLADCFKFRNRIGLDIALEALDIWARQRKRNLGKLMEFAKICRVTNIIRPYLEAKLV